MCKARGRGISYINAACAFDIETTSFYKDIDTGRKNPERSKRAIMYEWSFAIQNVVFIGRTWAGLLRFFDQLTQFYGLGEKVIMPIYVHNLSFEFQFLSTRMEWKRVFSVKERTPVYAQTVDGLEFRCSYLLTGYSLSKLGEKLQHHDVRKLVGDLDYSKIRHYATPMTDDEIGYCINDVLVLTAYIDEQIDIEGDVTKIPMTKTGYVRRYCYSKTMNSKDERTRKDYHEMIKGLTLEEEEYNLLKMAYMGGFTHASAWHSRQLLIHVGSFDFTSDYPARLVENKFPMSKGRDVEISEADIPELIKTHCLLMIVGIRGLCSKLMIDHPISASKCHELRGATEDNGRIVSADQLVTVITEQDYLTYRDFYSWDQFDILRTIAYRKDYLPTPLVSAVLDLYATKTELKGVEGKEKEYAVSKENLNSIYGMMVTDPCRESFLFEEGIWTTEAPDTEAALAKYNKSKNRFLFYPWGIWITAYARRALFLGMLEFKGDYVYSDTDSIKALNPEKHMDYINRINAYITYRMDVACKHHGIDPERTRPKTIDGVVKQLGVWDFEGIYNRFKTIGAKRYITEATNKKGELEISITVAGLNKKVAVPYLLDKYGTDGIFDAFDTALNIPPDYTGKLTHTYIDHTREGDVTDYTGVTRHYEEWSAVHLEKTNYDMNLSSDYLDYLFNVVQVEV